MWGRAQRCRLPHQHLLIPSACCLPGTCCPPINVTSVLASCIHRPQCCRVWRVPDFIWDLCGAIPAKSWQLHMAGSPQADSNGQFALVSMSGQKAVLLSLSSALTRFLKLLNGLFLEAISLLRCTSNEYFMGWTACMIFRRHCMTDGSLHPKCSGITCFCK